jgi:predicted transcriptional regulator YdeE
MTHRILQLEPMRIAGYAMQVSMSEVSADNPIPKFWGEVMQDGRFEKLMTLGSDCPGSYGVSVMHNDEDMDYIIGAALPVGADAPEGYYIANVPAGEYLEVETLLADLLETYGKLNELMSEIGYTWGHNTSFEFYDKDHDSTQLLKLYIPITKK